MKIDRTNYEIWLIDWLDGNLGEDQIKELELFLSENPDLRNELNEFGTCSLIPSDKSYPNRALLKKTARELPATQFEFLCVAFIEGDLSLSQQSEFLEMVNNDPDKFKTFNLLKKTQLEPVELRFNRKNKLLKSTLQQKVFRLSALGLSAAAAIAFFIVTFIGAPSELPGVVNNSAQEISHDTVEESSSVNQVQERLIAENSIENAATLPVEPIVKKEPENISLEKPDSDEIITVPAISRISEPVVNKISFNTSVDLKGDITANSLVASNIIFVEPEIDEERSNIGRFFAKTFREKILKDEVTPDTPLRGYEIAEAGVTGLNRLLGWEMTLNENNDENGELSSVNFSSRILKFNAPVRKNSLSE